MASILQEAPAGLEVTVEFMNGIEQDSLAKLCCEVINFLEYKTGAVKTEHWLQKIQETNRNADLNTVQAAVNSLIYLYRAAAGSQLTKEQFIEQLGTSVVFSQSTLSTLSNVWADKCSSLTSSGLVDHCLGVGQLVDVQWKLGMAMSSNTCKNLNSPFVCLALTVADTSGHLTTHDLELTLMQFRNFTNQLKEIASVLETV